MTKIRADQPTRRTVLAGAALGAGLIAMPGILRAQQLKWIGASATPQTDFIAQSSTSSPRA